MGEISEPIAALRIVMLNSGILRVMSATDSTQNGGPEHECVTNSHALVPEKYLGRSDCITIWITDLAGLQRSFQFHYHAHDQQPNDHRNDNNHQNDLPKMEIPLRQGGRTAVRAVCMHTAPFVPAKDAFHLCH